MAITQICRQFIISFHNHPFIMNNKPPHYSPICVKFLIMSTMPLSSLGPFEWTHRFPRDEVAGSHWQQVRMNLDDGLPSNQTRDCQCPAPSFSKNGHIPRSLRNCSTMNNTCGVATTLLTPEAESMVAMEGEIPLGVTTQLRNRILSSVG